MVLYLQGRKIPNKPLNPQVLHVELPWMELELSFGLLELVL